MNKMGKFKKNENGIYIIVGIIAFMFLFSDGGFLGSLITTCENTEPETLGGYEQYASDNNMTYTGAAETSVVYGNTSIIVTRGELLFARECDLCEQHGFTLVKEQNRSCLELIELVGVNEEVTKITVGGKDLYTSNSDNLGFCNNHGDIFIETTDYSGEYTALELVELYYDMFEQCTTKEVEVGENESVVIETDKVSGVTTFKTQETNPDLCGTTTCPEGYECQGTNGKSECVRIGETTEDLKTSTILGGMAILFAIYWIFEKGPKKGLIVDNKTRRRRR